MQVLARERVLLSSIAALALARTLALRGGMHRAQNSRSSSKACSAHTCCSYAGLLCDSPARSCCSGTLARTARTVALGHGTRRSKKPLKVHNRTLRKVWMEPLFEKSL